jgi:hypothetical protein
VRENPGSERVSVEPASMEDGYGLFVDVVVTDSESCRA